MSIKQISFIAATAALAATTLSTAAFAQRSAAYAGPARHQGFYGEVGGGYILEPDYDTAGVVGRVGYEVAYPRGLSTVFDAVAYEGEIFYGVLADEQLSTLGTIESKIDYAFSGSVRGIKAVSNRFDAHARVGIAYSSAEVESDSQFNTVLFDVNDSDTDLLLGLGGKFKLGESTGLRTDFTLQNDYELLSIGISQNF